jgi:bifunctional non-homologous end joining protein LigD
MTPDDDALARGSADRPMLATLAEPPLTQPGLLYEPKYDGIRALVHLDGSDVRIWSRLGNEKTSQFPSVVQALRAWGAALKRPVMIDGELVALDEDGHPAGFQRPGADSPPARRTSSASTASSPSR